MGVVVASVMGPTWIFVEVASMVLGAGLKLISDQRAIIEVCQAVLCCFDFTFIT
jgi:hypothetical protein